MSPGPDKPYRLCDYRFAFGDIFRHELRGYSFWGFCDIDVIFGDLRSFLPEALFRYDLLTFNATHVSGHFTLLRNSDSVCRRYANDLTWRTNISLPGAQFLDEENGYYGLTNVYAIESFNTPLSPYIPWTSGRYEFPSVWYFKGGGLSNNLDGHREFMYLHFMRYKSMWAGRSRSELIHFDGDNGGNPWKLTVDGFHPHKDPQADVERGLSITVVAKVRKTVRP